MFRKTLNVFVSGITALMLVVTGGFAPLLHPASADVDQTGTVTVSTNITEGGYSIFPAVGSDVMGVGTGVTPTTHVLTASDAPGTGYRIEYTYVSGQTTPDTVYFNLIENDTLSYNGVYVQENAPAQGTVTVSTNRAEGSYTIYPAVGNDIVGVGGGLTPTVHVLDASDAPGTGYRIVFGELDGYAPETIYFNLIAGQSLSFTHSEGEGIYQEPNTPTTGTVVASTNLAIGGYTIYTAAGNDMVGSGTGVTPTQHLLSASDAPGTGYRIEYTEVDNYTTPDTVYFNLLSNETILMGPGQGVGIYVDNEPPANNPTQGTAYLNTNIAEGSYSVYSATDANNENPLAVGGGLTVTEHTLDASEAPGTGYKVVFNDVDVPNIDYITPDTVFFNLVTTFTFTGVYNAENSGGGGNTYGTVEVNQIGGTGIIQLSGPTPFTISTASYSDEFSITDDYSLTSITAPTGSQLLTVTDGDGNALTAPFTQTLNRDATITYNVTYEPEVPAGTTVSISVRDEDGNAITDGNWILTDSAQNEVARGSEGITLDEADGIVAGAYTLTADTAGTPYDTVTITPSATQTVADAGSITFVLTYSVIPEGQPVVTIDKTAQITPAGDYVNYSIFIARSDDLTDTAVNVQATDTVSGTSVITGLSGGSLIVQQNSEGCSATSDGACGTGLITDNGGMNINLNTAGSTVTITYRALISNAGVPTNQDTYAINTATVTFNNISVSDTASVLITGPRSLVNPPAGSGGGVSTGGGGGGGSFQIPEGDFGVEIQKLVSLNGVDYRDASSESLAIIIPENKSTRLYNKVIITNPNKISARDIYYSHFFDTGESDMTADLIENLKGAELEDDGSIYIFKINGYSSVTFTYEVLIHENGKNDNPAVDGLELTAFHSGTPKEYDGHTYVGLGDQVRSYLFAGNVPAPVIQKVTPTYDTPGNFYTNGSNALRIDVYSDKSSATIGEMVNYTVTLENLTDDDMTNLYLSHFYPGELDSVSRGGARDDGRELRWQRPIIRAGEKASFTFAMKATGGGLGSVVRSLTTAMVNEYPNLSPTQSFLMIAGGTASSLAYYNLANTGPASLLIFSILAALAYFGFGSYKEYRYRRVKALALRDL